VADGAIVLILVLEALVVVKDCDGNAHAAFVAVAERLYTTDAAKSTLDTMKGFLGLRVTKNSLT
jgi:hypothetical protein